MPNSATQNEQVTQANVGTQTLQAEQPEVATQTEQVRQPKAATQTNEIKLEAFQPMFETFPDNMDELCTRLKTLQSKTEQIYWTEHLSPPNAAKAPRADRIAFRRRLCPDQVDDEPPARSQRVESPLASQQSTPTQLTNSQSSDSLSATAPSPIWPHRVW